MSETFKVVISKRDGTVLWTGIVPAEDVKIDHPPNAPSTCTISTRMLDASGFMGLRNFGAPS